MSSNYPDDIRNYDNDPRSPFYVQPLVKCKECGTEHDMDYMEEGRFNCDHLFCDDECKDKYELENYGCDECGKLECECE